MSETKTNESTFSMKGFKWLLVGIFAIWFIPALEMLVLLLLEFHLR